ncbi:hypothetical protein QQP08_013687 [Theobroma cacao]|nr:hypothetical protein QQP08_013687 [Theobroma cacao]
MQTDTISHCNEKLSSLAFESRCSENELHYSEKLVSMLATLLDFDLLFTHLSSWIDHGFVKHYEGKTKHRLWLELCDLLRMHATKVLELNVDAIISGGIRKFTNEVGRSTLDFAC